MEGGPAPIHPSLGYEFAREEEARAAASDLDRRFTESELAGLRIYRVRWNGNYLVEAAFSKGTPEARLEDARALLGESGTPVHPDDLTDYKRAREERTGLPNWLRRLFE
ncbi:hypothetical protein AVDCRST_MAG82-1890 [uncultured Rubrobacteraceae bacterium]|uniref:Uncharacterized protein n=1 Tax=uncultured Rubrobacteraceae bacterium TaxID=349277 RepID=A0A6J4Q191_9ACTN|nr:hypothetical protein AVDCRST_MAG82-1890 [uncultured Rubrobacteraceae bacterium]